MVRIRTSGRTALSGFSPGCRAAGAANPMTRLNFGTMRTETRLLIVALIGLIVVVAFTTLAAPSTSSTPLSIHSSERDGAMALRLWLEQSGYPIRELVSSPVQPSSVQALFVLDPITDYTDKEAST